MKIKNIMFSGFMGAVLATAANAAPTIASKNYVDSLVGARESALQTQITTNADAINNHADLIDKNSDAISAMDTAYKAADEATLLAAKTYTDDEITKLNESLTQTGGNVGALTNSLNTLSERVSTNETNISTNTGNISTNTAAIEALGQTVEANKAAAEKLVTDLADGAVATNTGAIATLKGDENTEGSVAKAIADAISASETTASNTYATKTYVDDQDTALDGRITTNANAIGTVANLTTTEKTNTVGAINEVNANVTTLMADAKTVGSVDNTVQTYAIPKPSDSDCNAASGLCVLSVSADGQTLTWVDVTDTVTNSDSGTSEPEA